MAREIVAFCDHHTETTGERVPGETRMLNLGGGPRQVELCDECYAELVTPLEKLLAAHGRDVSAVSDKRSGLRCVWCRATRKTARGLQDHVNTEHPENAQAFMSVLTAQGLRARRNRDDEALPEEEEANPYGKVACEICGKVVGKRGGLAGHMAYHRRQGDV